jgi:hypothetical protein
MLRLTKIINQNKKSKMKTLKFKLLQRRIASALVILFLLAPSMLSAVFNPQQVAAVTQMSHRHITISTSVVSATSVTYAVSFQVKTPGTIKGIVTDICQDSPLVGTFCDVTHGVTATPTTSTIGVSKNGGAATNYAVNAASTGTGLIILTDSTGISTLLNDVITYSFTATNPSGTITSVGATGTFYGRLITYSTTADAVAYDHSTTGNANNPGANVLDQGGLAMSTAKQLTTNARVQEQLSFCVGGTTVNDAVTQLSAGCGASFAGSGQCGANTTTVDLGVIDNTAVNVSPVDPQFGGNGCNGAAMVQTNASFGVSVTYYAQPDSGSQYHPGALKVGGIACSDDGSPNPGHVVTQPSTNVTDQCFNSDPAQAVFSVNAERFGVTVAAINCGSSTTYGCNYGTGVYSMVRNAVYDGTGGNTYPTDGSLSDLGRVSPNTQAGYAWDDGDGGIIPRTLADSGSGSIKVVDNEVLLLKFAAAASITTPTGQYTVVSTYVATPSY